MPAPGNPAITSLLQSLGKESLWGQVLIRPAAPGWELRHADDAARPDAELRPLSLSALRDLAMHTEEGAFRPLKSAPNLRAGWRCTLHSPGELHLALGHLYPGSVADWHAARAAAEPPVTNYREFTSRQTGMYRITTFLSDDDAAAMARAACHSRFCLKQRLWTVPGLPPDAPEGKSAIPCLEPCAILLEFARKTVRITQEPPLPLTAAPSELQTLCAALEASLDHPARNTRAADFNSPLNPRRVQLLLEKWRARLEAVPSATKEE